MTPSPELDALARAVDSAASDYASAVSLPWPIAPHAAIFDGGGEALATTSVAVVGALGAAVTAVRTFFGEAWQPGDVAITNDQDAGSLTACDFTAVVPAWPRNGGGPALWIALRAPFPDFGGWEIGGFSPQAVDRWAEGARFEAAKLVAGGRARREVSDMLMLNSRTPKLILRCVQALAASAGRLAEAAQEAIATIRNGEAALLADTLLAPELERIDQAVSRLARRAAKGSAPIRTPFPEPALGPVQVTAVPGNDGVTVSIEAPPIASRPINLAPGAAADIVTAAVGGALDLHALRTGALRRRLKTKIPSSTLVSASVPAPVCLGLATTGAAVFAATVAAMADAGIAADGAALWRSHVAVQGNGAFDRATGKITPARAAAIRAREAEEASA